MDEDISKERTHIRIGESKMAGKRSSGEGSISYDKRRKRYRARVTTGWEINEKTGRSKQVTQDIGSSFKTKGEASAALAEYLDRPFDLNDKNITFNKLYERWYEYFVPAHESEKYRIKSAYQYCSSIYDKKVRDITTLDMKNCIYKGTRKETKGKHRGEQKLATPATRNSIKFLFNHIFGYAAEARLIERNYAKDFSLDKQVWIDLETNRKVKIPFSKKEMDKLWRSEDFVPFADMIIYACYSGWRPDELVLLKIADVNLKEGYIKGGVKTDAGKNRIVPIHPLVRHIVERRYKEAVRIGSEYLFNDPSKKKGIGLSYDQYLTRFNNAILLLGFRKEITPHYTRHTFITKAKSKTVKMDEYILKLIVGHKIGDITEHVYTHREIKDLIDEMKLIKE